MPEKVSSPQATRLRELPAILVTAAAAGSVGLFGLATSAEAASNSPFNQQYLQYKRLSKQEYLHYKSLPRAITNLSKRLVSANAKLSVNGGTDLYWDRDKKGHFTRRTTVPVEAIVKGKEQFFEVLRNTDPENGEALSLQLRHIPRKGMLRVEGEYTYGPSDPEHPGFTIENPITALANVHFNEHGRPVAELPFENTETDAVTVKTVPVGRTWHIDTGAIVARAGVHKAQ